MQLAPSALHTTAETLTRHLGADTWQVDELITNSIINLDGPHDRQIGMRLGRPAHAALTQQQGGDGTRRLMPSGMVRLPCEHEWPLIKMRTGAEEPACDTTSDWQYPWRLWRC
ncbi:hypothetical protein [Streptomyces sp. NPDC056190]|uniref:hypothetical protein n=1 Tax=unclassified Streptomyces TaxID=2593676 RepID=UPI0035DDA494